MSNAYPPEAVLSDTLGLFAQHRPTLVALLRQRAREAYQHTRRPVSVNDVRAVLDSTAYVGDARVLAAAFPRKEWLAVGYTTTNSTAAHARTVRTFIPRDLFRRHPEHRAGVVG